VLTSSTAVLGGSRRPRVMDEETTSSAGTIGLDYFISKQRGEEVALDLAARGLPLVVVRPSFVLGPGDVYGSSASVVRLLALRRMPVYVQGGASFCDVRDVARGHVEALERGRVGEAYILGGHNLTMDVVVERVCRMAGVAPPLRVPYALASAALRVMGVAHALGGPPPAVAPDLLLASSLYTFVTSAKAQRELGYAIRPFEESARDTLRWYLLHGGLAASTPELEALAKGLERIP
jgi:dihydroflavonol-4-reductase